MAWVDNHASYNGDRRTPEQWREYIAGGRSKTARPVANNTTVRIESGDKIAIKLHQTDIVTFNGNGTITLSSGGWRSATTKERINRYTNAGIYQRAGVWYMRDGSLFYDGIPILDDGTTTAPRQPAKYEQQLKVLKKQAKEYARGYVQALKDGLIDYPSAGDCWGCYFGISNSKNDPNPMGTDHLRQHMEEKYYVPSLLVNAGRDAGYRDDQIGLMGIGGHRLFVEPERIIYKYIVKHLGKEL